MDVGGLDAIWRMIVSSFLEFYNFLRTITVPVLHISLLAFLALCVVVGAVLYLVVGYADDDMA